MDVLIRFRLNRIALITDVSCIYRIVLLEESDKDLHRFVWRRDASEPLRDYRMTRVTLPPHLQPIRLSSRMQLTSPLNSPLLQKPSMSPMWTIVWLAQTPLRERSPYSISSRSYLLVVASLCENGIAATLLYWSSYQRSSRTLNPSVHCLTWVDTPRPLELRETQ